MATEKLAMGLQQPGDDSGRHMRFRQAGPEWLASTTERFTTHLEQDGLRVALGYINSTTRFRFTGAYRFKPPMLSSIGIFDRENPALALAAEVEMATTYCSIIGAGEDAFAVDDAAQDARVSTHPAREKYAAYCGVPLRTADGAAFGTLCHFDPRPRIGTVEQLDLLERVSPVLAAYVLARAG
jgi:GAF domain-containing protein